MIKEDYLMKRIFAGLLTLYLLAALTVPCLAAESGGVVQTVKALGILTAVSYTHLRAHET